MLRSNISIYIHWPWCLHKCPYCDFNSHLIDTSISEKLMLDSLKSELLYYFKKIGARNTTSIFFGGGTPSLMKSDTCSKIIDFINKYLPIDKNAEITLEANPTSIESSKLTKFYKSGINRLSLGIQSFNEDGLKFLGRNHNVSEAIRAAESARSIFPRFSFDLISSRPKQSLKQWELELKVATKYIKDHISVYQLTIEKGTPFYSQYKKGLFSLPREHKSLDIFKLTREILVQEGLYAYEISNHSIKGSESKHNLNVWEYRDYIGIGPGAHSRIKINNQIYALESCRKPSSWIKKIKNNGNGIILFKKLCPKEAMQEAIILGLRLSKGINIRSLEKKIGIKYEDVINLEFQEQAAKNNLVSLEKNNIKITSSGTYVLNTLISKLLL